MDTEIINYIEKIEGYKTAIKNLHWAAKHMSEHKLMDDFSDILNDYEDELAEVAQGVYGRIKLNGIKPKFYKIQSSKKCFNDILKDTNAFHNTLKGDKLKGLKSVIESFLADVDKHIYLLDFCINEDNTRNRYKRIIREVLSRI